MTQYISEVQSLSGTNIAIIVVCSILFIIILFLVGLCYRNHNFNGENTRPTPAFSNPLYDDELQNNITTNNSEIYNDVHTFTVGPDFNEDGYLDVKSSEEMNDYMDVFDENEVSDVFDENEVSDV